MQTLLHDLRYGVRLLLKKPVFTIVIILTLALGIGANTAIFSVINTVLLEPLPYPDPDRLVMVWEKILPSGENNTVAPPNFVDWREQNRSFADMASYVTLPVDLTGAGEPEKIEGLAVTDNFFQVLGAQPFLGSTFQPGEVKPGSLNIVIMSYGLWQRRFGGDPNILGQPITINGYPVPVGAVMPPAFQFPTSEIDLWVPTVMARKTSASRVAAHYLQVIARLNPGVTHSRAQADMDAISARLQEQYPDTNRYIGSRVTALHEQLSGNARPALLLLFAAAGFVLLIACANVANLLLARAAARQKEMAVRVALGAGRLRLIRQLLTESLLLAFSGGAAGLLLALWGIPFLVSFIPNNLILIGTVEIDFTVLGFTLAISLLTGVFFGLMPALQAGRVNINEALKEGGRDNSIGGRDRLRSLLVVAEVALALVLLVGAGLLIKSFIRLNRVDPGFEPGNLLTMEVAPPYSKYPDTTRRAAFYDELLQRVEALPGVEAAGVITTLPLKPQRGTTTAITGGLATMTFITEQPLKPIIYTAVPRNISPGYFRAMGIPVLKGRPFNAQDREDSPGVVIISESMARRSWPGEEAVGKRMKMGIAANPWLTVVGVVKDVRLSLNEAPHPHVYVHYGQTAVFGPRDLVVRTRSDAASLTPAVRREVWAIDKDLPVSGISTMSQILPASLARERFNMLLLAVFALLALALAAVGIYGVMSYTVTQHTREIGIRMALGAQTRDVLKLIVGQGMVLTFVGLLIGLGAAFALTRLMSGLLYGVSATDPLTFTLIALLLAGVALMACYVPARRATRVDPMAALRYE
ncbi:MAG: ABC transporter permease [Blastocatellia bacterium]|nr:ABC transporter permease [Blastocatellia bacterium]